MRKVSEDFLNCLVESLNSELLTPETKIKKGNIYHSPSIHEVYVDSDGRIGYNTKFNFNNKLEPTEVRLIEHNDGNTSILITTIVDPSNIERKDAKLKVIPSFQGLGTYIKTDDAHSLSLGSIGNVISFNEVLQSVTKFDLSEDSLKEVVILTIDSMIWQGFLQFSNYKKRHFLSNVRLPNMYMGVLNKYLVSDYKSESIPMNILEDTYEEIFDINIDRTTHSNIYKPINPQTMFKPGNPYIQFRKYFNIRTNQLFTKTDVETITEELNSIFNHHVYKTSDMLIDQNSLSLTSSQTPILATISMEFNEVDVCNDPKSLEVSYIITYGLPHSVYVNCGDDMSLIKSVIKEWDRQFKLSEERLLTNYGLK